MSWFQTGRTTIVVISARENREPMRTFLRQVRGLGYEVNVLQRITYDVTARIPAPQVVLLDSALPTHGPANPVAAIKSTWEYVPVILLASATEMPQLRFASEMQDFLTIPASVPELDTRIRFALWKTHGSVTARDTLEAGPIRLNLATYEAMVNNRRVELTYKEFELLKHFIQHPRRVFSRPELLEAVWESDYYGETRTIDVHIRRLRAKLGVAGNMIHTVRNVGYRFG